MPQKRQQDELKPRGMFERPPGFGVWWIQYWDVDGKRRREKVGQQAEASKRYDKLKKQVSLVKSAKRAGVWVEKPKEGVTISELIDDVLVFTAEHKDARSYISKAKIVRRDLSSRVAESLTPQEIDGWLKKHCKTPAATIRYEAFFSICYREGMANGKIKTNTARAVRHRKEPEGRLNFLRRDDDNDEYRRLQGFIANRFPAHLAEFEVSVHSGMRLGEQYRITWSQVDLERGVIRLQNTKNNHSRNVHLNRTARAAITSIQPKSQSHLIACSLIPTPILTMEPGLRRA